MSRRRNKVTRTSVEERAAAARRDGAVLNLSGYDLAGSDWSGFDFTCDAYNGLFNSQILGVDFRNARLAGANLFRVDLASANLRGTDLSGAALTGTNLYTSLLQSSNLTNADLRGANLVSAELNNATLENANFASARFGWTALAGVDLSKASNLDQSLHVYPSPVDATTLRLTAHGLASATDPGRGGSWDQTVGQADICRLVEFAIRSNGLVGRAGT